MKDLKAENKVWINETWDKIVKKLNVVSKRAGEKIAYTTIDGVYTDKSVSEKEICWWTNGFWPGILWLMYHGTKDESYRKYAEGLEEKLDTALYSPEGIHHDVGFMWLLSSVANYRLTGNLQSKKRGLIAADYLMSRFNPDSRFLTAWNSKEKEGWSIIDTMMNLGILYWASDETGYRRFRDTAIVHADKSAEYHIRPDGSVNHVNVYDVVTGEFVGTTNGQGINKDSSWSRGQSWAIYGYALSYIHTGNQKYLDLAKKVAHYFIANVCDTYVPRVDFRAPAEPHYVDTTAGAIAACGLIEISRNVPEYEKMMYINAAVNILMAMDKAHCNWSDNCDAILMDGTEAYGKGVHMSIIYGDFYFIEAIQKLRDSDILLW